MMESKFSFDSAELNSGELVGCSAIEITSIPDISVLSSRFDKEEDAWSAYKAEAGSLLSELYQNYKQNAYQSGELKDVSYEFLWVTEGAKNQPFKAIIRLFLVLREIDTERVSMKSYLLSLLQMCCASMSLQKYNYRLVDLNELNSILHNVDTNRIRAIVKDERIENLQSQMLPQCYAFDVLSQSDNDLSRIVNALVDYPNCAVSFQLIPTQYTYQESLALGQVSQALNTLSHGVSEQGGGSVSIAAAESLSEKYRYYDTQKNNPLFTYNIVVYGNEQSTIGISSRLYGQLCSTALEAASLKFVDLLPADVALTKNTYALPWSLNELLLSVDRSPTIWNGTQHVFSYFYRFPFIITAEEASNFFRLPIGSSTVSAGLTINESLSKQKTYTDNIINSGDIVVGKLKTSAKGDTIGFPLNDLAKHMLIVGTPGSGKTTFSVSLLDRLWKEHSIPFLVIEPAKNEYRALVQSIPELQVFTPGKNFISPFVFNPFVLPKNVKLETYKSTLKTAFAAAVSMSTPLDKIFEEAVNNCYSDFRWLDTYTIADKGRIFNIADFIKCFQQTFDAIGYTGEAKNIGRAGVVRLNSLVNLFDNYFSIPIEDLLKKPTVIELAAIENADQKSLIIALVLLSILAYVNANYIGEGGLKNVILLEEAHVLLASDSGGQSDANPSAIAQGLVKRMLAEIRSYGVGVVIADQSPRKVSTDVVGLTDMKVVFRLVESEDKQIIGDSTNMSDAQVQRMSKLKPGEAFLFFNKLDEPEEVITPDYRLENNISITLSDDGIKSLSTYWNDRGQMLKPYPECQYCSTCQRTCDYSRRILAREIARRIFVKNFKLESKDFESIRKVFGQISNLIKAELNDEQFTSELLSCVKVHLWRKIKYSTKIPITDKQVVHSLQR